MSVSICWVSIDKSVSLFHTQFVLDLFFFLSSFSLTVFIKLGKLSGVNYPLGNRLRANCLGGNYPGTIILGNFAEANHQGGNFPVGNYPRGNCLVSNHLGSNCPEGNYPWGNFPRRQLPGPPGKVSLI